MTGLSFRTRRNTKHHGVTYSFLFMEADGDQLHTPLIDTGKIRPVADRVLPFDETLQAMEYVEEERAKTAKQWSQ
ncbi:zinc-binding dehydrogenase [Streptomyces sp. NPDC017520]|uniref:zinc-binding dehydrogenase n=1 Tax=Streptomyces sp. NPDC017520 TaxID=3364998 RepID=UPI0037882D51